MKKLILLIGLTVNYAIANPIIIKPYPTNFSGSNASMVTGYGDMINQFTTSTLECALLTPKNVFIPNTKAEALYKYMSVYILSQVFIGFFKNVVDSTIVVNQDISTLEMTTVYNGMTVYGTKFVPLYKHIAKCVGDGLNNYPSLNFRSPQQATALKDILLTEDRDWFTQAFAGYSSVCQNRESDTDCQFKYSDKISKAFGLTKQQFDTLSHSPVDQAQPVENN